MRVFLNIKVARLLLLAGLLSANATHAQSKPTTDYKVPAPTGNTSLFNPVPSSYGTTMLLNSVTTWMPLQPYTTEASVSSTSNTVNNVSKTTQYSDMLGRPIQTVAWQASPGGKDIVSPVYYNDPTSANPNGLGSSVGSDEYKYLPYTATTTDGQFKYTAFADQSTFYSSTYSGTSAAPGEQPALIGEQMFYSHTDYEASPANRVLKTFAPGNSWAGSEGGTAEKSVQQQYLVNASTDNVQIWNITSSYSFNDASASVVATTSANSFYGSATNATLYKTVLIDEAGNQSIEFKDVDGHVVLKKSQTGTVSASSPYTNWLCTYYVYDDLGLLRCVIPPKAVAEMVATSSWVLTSTMISDLCYWFCYDGRQRMIAKKTPGADWQYIIYDIRDRPVFTQDGNLRIQNEWMYTLYDALDRPVQTGVMQQTAYSTPTSLQTYVNGLTNVNSTSSNTTNNQYSVATNLTITQRDGGRPLYQASSSITFEASGTSSFVSEPGAYFVAQIVPATTATTTNTQTVNIANPTNISGATIVPLILTFYDNYTQASSQKAFSAAITNYLDGGSNTAATLLTPPSSASAQTFGMLTSVKTRVLENPTSITTLATGAWLEAVSYYDNKGRTIQVIADNYKGGEEFVAKMYNFQGMAVCNYRAHNNPAGTATTLNIKTNTNYDAQGRIKTVTKEINNSATTLRTIVSNSYDALGHIKNAKIGEQTNGPAAAGSFPQPVSGSYLENENYATNIRGWLKGINWNYGASGGTTSQANYQNNQWFSMDLGYDWGFAKSGTASNQFNGNLAGQRWKAAGDGKERAYGFAYDPVNRMMKADFTQNFGTTTPTWQNTDPNNTTNFLIDYSVQLGDGNTPSSAYDENGNLQSMQQKGMIFSNNTYSSPVIDQIAYTYNKTTTTDVTNKLAYATQSASNYSAYNLGNFTTNYANTSNYTYDQNGNVTKDVNKGSTTTYSFLNLPYLITFNTPGTSTLKGTITYIYDAGGNKLEKRTTQSSTTTTTTYIAGIEYQNNVLQYFMHENGKIRPQRDGNGNLQGYVYDYFIKDNLGNIRTVLTDQQQQDVYYAATLENGSASYNTTTSAVYDEEPFYNIVSGNIVSNTSIQGLPTNPYPNNNGIANPNPNSIQTPGTSSQYMYELTGSTVTGSTQQMGLGITLKVMAGDKIDIFGKSYYYQNTSTSTNQLPIASIIAGFLGTPAGTGAAVNKQTTATFISNNSADITAFGKLQTLQQTDNSSNATMPRAFINYIIFDNNFQVAAYGADPVFTTTATNYGAGTVKDYTNEAPLHNISVPCNGYVYVYCSNESPNTPVYFDNLQVVDTHGPLVEENHYYPAGLMMAGISNRALNFAGGTNYYRYQGKEMQDNEFSDGSGLQQYDFAARYYDQQLGVWHNQDPAAQFASPYVAMGNNWANQTDPDGRYAGYDDLIAAGLGAIFNVAGQALSGNIHGVGSFFSALATGAAAGEATLYGGPMAGGAVLGLGNSLTNQLSKGGTVDLNTTLTSTVIGAALGDLGGGLNSAISPFVNSIVGDISSPVIQNAISGAISGAFEGGIIGGLSSTFQGGSFSSGALSGLAFGAGSGFVGGTISGFKIADERDVNPWTGNMNTPPNQPGPYSTSPTKLTITGSDGKVIVLNVADVSNTSKSIPNYQVIGASASDFWGDLCGSVTYGTLINSNGLQVNIYSAIDNTFTLYNGNNGSTVVITETATGNQWLKLRFGPNK